MDDLERLGDAVEGFCRLVEGLPAAERLDQPWGPKEVLAHLVYWHESYGRQLEAALSGRPVILPVGRFKDLNAQAVAASRSVGVAQLAARFRAADRRLRQLARDPRAATIAIEIKQGSKRWPLGELIQRAEAHVRNHSQEVKRTHLRQAPRGGAR